MSPVATHRVSREERAWAAGFFDGEGCFTIRRASQYGDRWHRRARPVATLANTDFDALQRFHVIAGVGTIRKRTPVPDRKPCWLWATSGAGVTTVYELLAPWLSERRLQRVQEILRETAAPFVNCPGCGALFRKTRNDRIYCTKICGNYTRNVGKRKSLAVATCQ
jgi:hypothetical protein